MKVKPIYLLLAGVALAYGGALTPHWRLHPDSAVYIGLAESMVQGKGYSFNGTPHLLYPPVFPLMLVPLVWCFGRNFLAVRVLSVLLASCNVYLTYRLLRACVGERTALILAAMVGFSVFVIEYTTFELTEIPYTFFSLLGLLAGRRLLRESGRGLRWAFLTALILVAAFMTKLVGLALVLGICAALLNKFVRAKNSRQLGKLAVIVLICFVPLSLWIFRVQRTLKQGIDPPRYERRSPTYWGDFVRSRLFQAEARPVGTRELFGRAAGNVRFLGQDMANLAFNARFHLGPVLRSLPEVLPIFLLPVAMVLTGLVFRLRRRPGPMEFYFILYVLVLVVFGAYGEMHGVRFVVPLIPLIYCYMFLSVSILKQAIISLASCRLLWRILTILLVVYCLTCLVFKPPGHSLVELRLGFIVAWVLMAAAVLLSVLFALGYRLQRTLLHRFAVALILLCLANYFLLGTAKAGLTALRRHRAGAAYDSVRGGDEFARTCEWLKDNVSQTGVVMTATLRLTHSLTGLKCVDLPTTSELEDLAAYLQKWRVTQVLLGSPLDLVRPQRAVATEKALGESEIMFQQVFSAGGCKVLQVAGPPST